MPAAKALATLPLVVLAATTAALVVVKIRSERRARALAHSPASGVVVTAAPPRVKEPGIGVDAPLGAGRVDARGARMLHEDAARTHRAFAKAPRAPRERWHVTLGGPIVAQPTTSPDERTVYASSLDGALVAIDRASGAVRWKVDLGDRAYATPTVANDGTVFVGSDRKKLFAVTPAGAIAWTLEVDGEADTAPLLFGPDRDHERLAFAAGATVHVVTTRGEEKARFRAKKKVFTAPAAAPDGTLYFGSQDHRAYALKPDGTLAWSTDLEADVDGGPAVTDDGAIAFGTDGGRVTLLEPAHGAIVWSTDVGGYVRGALSIGRDGAILAGVYGPTPGVVRLAPADGHLVGAFRIAGTGSPDFGVHGGPVEDQDGTLIFGAEDDRVYGVERSGTVRFTLERGADVDAPVTVTKDGALIVGADDGTVAEFGD